MLLKVLSYVKRNGLKRTINQAAYRLGERWYEERLGIHSAPAIELSTFGIHERAFREYRATDYLTIRRVMKGLAIKPGQDVLVEYGAGMGRVLVTAATYPFRKIIGIELVPELSEIARRNIESARARLKCQDLEIVTADARHYVVPGDASVFYLYNPFGGDTLAVVFDNIRRSIHDRPRPHTIAYVRPPRTGEGWVGQQRWLTKRRELSGFRGQEIFFYDVTG
jgi:hypothetical protein